VSFEPGPEDSYGRCGSDKIRQTVPDTSSGDRESSVTDGRQSGVAYELRDKGLVWLIGAVVYLCAAPRVQLFASAGTGWLHNVSQYH